MDETLMSCCAEHGVTLNAEHVEAVGKLFDGALLKKLLALVKQFGPQLAPEIPAILADLAAGNYLAALMLIISALTATT